MERLLCVVAREQPLLVGYLMTAMSAQASEGRLVEIKLDERRAERRLSRDAKEPERRRGERRLQPSLAREFRSRGYATVVQSTDGSSRTVEPAPAPAMVWRPRSSRGQRVARAGRRSRVWWGLMLALLAGVGIVVVVARAIHWRPAPPPPAAQIEPETTPQIPPQIPPRIAPRVEQTSPPPPASREATVVPTVPPPPAAPPEPVRVVGARFSGVVLSVDPTARVLVLEDGGGAGAAGRQRVQLAPDARVVVSERDAQAEDPSRPFKDTPISLSDIGRGDYLIVERRGPPGKELAHSIVVTFRNMR
jgi:hypothetical protein